VASAILGGPFDSLTLWAGRAGFPTGNQALMSSFHLEMSWREAIWTRTVLPFLPGFEGISSAPLEPGGRLFFAVHNSRPGETNNFTLQVNLDSSECHGPRQIIRLRDGIAYTNAIAPVDRLFDYYVYKVTPIAEKVEFELIPQNGDLGMVIRQGLPCPT
jgi:hypothetical protein